VRVLLWFGLLLVSSSGLACDPARRPRDAGLAPEDVATSGDAAVADDAPGSDAPGSDAPGSDAPVPATDASFSTTDATPPLGCDGPAGRTLDVLFVGNSQIDFWNMARLVSSLSQSAPASCPRIVGTKHTQGGANLRDLWDRTDLEAEIATGGYEVVVITESIDLADMRPPFPALFQDYARRIVAATRAAGAVPVFYATGYVERRERFGFREMADPQITLGAELGVDVATGGLAWLRAWERMPALDLYHSDRAHPGFVGSYLSALVIYATILDASPVGLTNMPRTDCTDGPCTPISAELAAELQAVAWEEHLSR